jgi:hypothetical protein
LLARAYRVPVLIERTGDVRAPLGFAAAVVASCAVLAVADPEAGGYPVCPTRSILGIDCPLCGSLRGVSDLARGHVRAALDHNLLLLAIVPLAAVAWWRWLRASARGERPATVPRLAVGIGVAVLVVFTVLRNLPVDSLSWLDSA